jgi:hypothetical protein
MSKAARRHHLGSGALPLDSSVSVFINCPLDGDFWPTFDAIVFSTVCCGFFPRCAIESGNVAESRMERIVRAIEGSRYSIHDLSRCRGEGEANLARFNMPLELGIAMAQRLGRGWVGRRHDWLLLVPQGHVYKRFVSDLAGYDPEEYDGDAAGVVPVVVRWLATRPDALWSPAPREVLDALPRFRAEREALAYQWVGREPWPRSGSDSD